ncbi:Low-affinity potassium transport protein, partial [Pseudocercospora fuligena]
IGRKQQTRHSQERRVYSAARRRPWTPEPDLQHYLQAATRSDLSEAMRLAAIFRPLKRPFRHVRRLLPPLNFISIHYAYFILTCLLSAIILWAADTNRDLRFIDALFLAVSAMTLAGLNTINLSTLDTFQQFWLFLLIIIGSAVLVSAFVVQVRKRAFETKFKDVVTKERQRRIERRSRSRSRAGSRRGQPGAQEHQDLVPPVDTAQDASADTVDTEKASKSEASMEGAAMAIVESPTSLQEPILKEGATASGGPTSPTNISFRPDTVFSHEAAHQGPRQRSRGLWSAQGVGARSTASIEIRSLSREGPRIDHNNSTAAPPKNRGNIGRYFHSTSGWIGRNSEFHGLTDKEREHLGGYEYRAVCFLAWLVPIYLFLMQLLGCIGCAAWVAVNRSESTTANGLNAWWVGAFNAVSAFNNSGMSLLDANMTAFQTGYYLLITMSFLILAGNTCYPIFLRLIIWAIYKVAIEQLPVGVRVIDGLFQAFAVRSGGFYVVAISQVRIGLQVLYVVMMYISVYPVVITMRNSNVYEERSLGIYAEDQPDNDDQANDKPGFLRQLSNHFVTGGASGSESNSSFVRQQLRAQLAHDVWTIFLALFAIVIIETSQFDRDPTVFSVFNFLFEIVSAYGCVGISLGVPWDAYSFCGTWHTASKLILCAVMLRGRHRGLPVAIDRAVLLPGEEIEKAEEDDGRIRLQRTISRGRSTLQDV